MSKSAFRRYFEDLWLGIYSTWKGLALTGKYFFKPKVTLRYPEERPVLPPVHRGLHIYGEDECTLCRACELVCPVKCISIKAVGKGKEALILSYDIDYSRCLFCNLCCEACKPECINMGGDYDLSTTSREDCVVHFARVKSAEEIAEQERKLAEKEAEKKAKAEAAAREKSAENKPGDA